MRGPKNAFHSIIEIIITPNFIEKNIRRLVKINWWIDVTNILLFDVKSHRFRRKANRIVSFLSCGDINWTRSQLYKFQSQIFVGFDVRSAIKVILNKCCGEQARRWAISRGAVIGKTDTTSVLPWFFRIEHGGSSGSSRDGAPDLYNAQRTNLGRYTEL